MDRHVDQNKTLALKFVTLCAKMSFLLFILHKVDVSSFFSGFGALTFVYVFKIVKENHTYNSIFQCVLCPAVPRHREVCSLSQYCPTQTRTGSHE